MSKIELTAENKLKLEARHKQVRDIREGDRIKAVLLNSEGWSTTMIAQALRKHENLYTSSLEGLYRRAEIALCKRRFRGEIKQATM